MPIITKNIRDISIITADVDRATTIVAESFKNSVTYELSAKSSKFIINLSSCEFIDSTFLSALVVANKRIVEKGGILKIAGLKPAVNSMFQLTRLDKIFDIYKNEKEALDTLAK